MDGDVITVLQGYEEMVRIGRISKFCVSINDMGLLIMPEDSDGDRKYVPLSQGLRSSLGTFFHDVDSITYPSLDYTTLVTLIKAHTCISRITDRSLR